MSTLFAAHDPDAHGSPLPITIAPLSPEHLEGCVALAVQREGGDPAAWRASLEQGIEGADRATFVGLAEGRVVGYATVGWLVPGAGDPGSQAPDGWYLLGLIVDPRFRRRGVGRRLTEERLRWLRGRTEKVWYFASSANQASIDLHSEFGFRLTTENLELPGVSFTASGLLFGADVALDDLAVARGVVKYWKPDKGWGAISSADLPPGRDAFAHFSAVEAEGYRELRQGQKVLFRYRPAEQDSFRFVADWVRAIED